MKSASCILVQLKTNREPCKAQDQKLGFLLCACFLAPESFLSCNFLLEEDLNERSDWVASGLSGLTAGRSSHFHTCFIFGWHKTHLTFSLSLSSCRIFRQTSSRDEVKISTIFLSAWNNHENKWVGEVVLPSWNYAKSGASGPPMKYSHCRDYFSVI